uniref:Putative HNH homing endonuclease n=1 Tax=Stephanosphaera pluvialis TaxID=51712 RepID=A0A0S2IDN3_9CHLO|nr:putative HNH homing endonuclease [Stephanosphaera pluvialis]
MVKLINNRDHKHVSGELKTNQREICYVISCPRHNYLMTTSFFNYKRSKFGCKFCGKESVSKKLIGRTFTPKTLLKMKIAANLRPFRGGRPRRWRETYEYRVWNLCVRQECKNECAITGVRNVSRGDRLLVVHHLMGAGKHASLILTIENGILIHNKLHTLFHKKYGYNGNTVEQFMDFLLKLKKQDFNVLISSQTVLGGTGGSETRVYNPERIKKLHERLNEIKNILKT